jgi:hypothetical protein
MSLADVKIKVSTAFAKIGNVNGTAMPQNDDNRFSIAWEYLIAKALKSMAEKREEKAKEAAKSAGLLDGDFEPGTTVTTYRNSAFNIIAKTANPASRIDAAVLNSELMKELGVVKAAEIIAKATVKNKAATSFDFVE